MQTTRTPTVATYANVETTTTTVAPLENPITTTTAVAGEVTISTSPVALTTTSDSFPYIHQVDGVVDDSDNEGQREDGKVSTLTLSLVS